jgi:hypothetical protein
MVVTWCLQMVLPGHTANKVNIFKTSCLHFSKVKQLTLNLKKNKLDFLLDKKRNN